MIKIILFCTLGIIIFLMVRSIRLGINITKKDPFKTPGERTQKHKKNGRILVWCLPLLVILLEIIIHNNGGVRHVDSLLYWHIGFAVLYGIMLIVLNSSWSGLKNPKLHKIVAYGSLVPFIIMVGTAIAITIRL